MSEMFRKLMKCKVGDLVETVNGKFAILSFEEKDGEPVLTGRVVVSYSDVYEVGDERWFYADQVVKIL